MSPTQLIYEECSPLSKQAAATGSTVLSRAFFSDPLFSYAQPSHHWRRGGMPAIFRMCLRRAARLGGVWWSSEAVFAWLPLQHLSAGLAEQLASGGWAVPLRFGMAATRRIEKHGDWCDRRMAALVPENAAYVYFVGVEPSLAGQGIGSNLMNNALAKIAESHTCCALRTEQPKNVRFYEKLGFVCVEHAVVPVSEVPVWFFVRPLSSRPTE